MTTDEFIEWLAPAAQAQTRCYNLPASVLIAQGAIESGWGRAVIGQYNLFGAANGTAPGRILNCLRRNTKAVAM